MKNLLNLANMVSFAKQDTKPFNPLTYNDPNGSELVSFWYSKTAEATDTQVIDAMGDETRPVQPGRCYNFDGVDDYVLAGFAPELITNGTIEFTIKTTDASGMFMSDEGGAGTYYLGPFDQGSSITNLSQNSGTPIFYIDNVLLAPLTRGGLYAAIADGDFHTVKITNVDMSSYPTKLMLMRYFGGGFVTSGKVYDWKFDFNSDGNWDCIYKMDESAGTVAFDSSGNGNHGTITNATLSTFHATDIDIPYSWQNEVGYKNYAESIQSGTYGSVSLTEPQAWNTIYWEGCAHDRSINPGASLMLDGPKYLMIADETISNPTFAGKFGVYGTGVEWIGSGVKYKKYDVNKYMFQRNTNNTVSFYQNNVLIGTSSISNTVTNNLVTINSGYGTGAGGLFSNFRIYNKILSDTERETLFTTGELSSGVVLHYECGGTNPWKDLVGTNDGIQSNESTLIAPAINGTQDVMGNTLQYTGRVKYNLDMVGSHCVTFDGVNDYGDLQNTDLFSKTKDFSGSISFIDEDGVAGTIIHSAKSADDRFAIQVNQGAYNVTVGVWNGSSYASKSASITTNIPYKLDFSYDSSAHSMTATLNGVAMTGTTTPSITADVGCYIGSLTSGSTFFSGKLWKLSVGGFVFPISEGKGTRSYSKTKLQNTVDWVNINESTFYSGDGVLFDGSNDYGDLHSGSMLDLTKDFVVSYTVKDLVPSVSHNMVLGCSFSDIPYLGWHHTGLVEVRSDTGTTATFVGKGTNTYTSGRFVYTKVGNQLTLAVYSLAGVLLATDTQTWTNTGNICINRISGQSTGYRLNGRLLNLTISADGKEIYEFAFDETSGTQSYSYTNQYIKWMNTTESSFWGSTQDTYHHNITEGYSDGVNLLKYSEQFDNAYWNEASANYDIATASFYPTITGAYRGMFATVGITLAEVRTITIKVKYKGFKFFCIIGPDGSGTQAGWFDIETGVLGSVVGSGFSHSIKTAEDGYYYCSLHCPAVVTAGYIQFMVTDVNNNFIATANGTNGVYIASAQYEKGSIFTTYQKTEDSPTAGALIPSFDSTTDVLGNTLTNPAGNFHNGAETKLRVPDAPALRQDNSSFLYTGATPNDITYSDIVANTGDQIFADTSTSEKKNIMVYDQVLIDPALKKVEKFTNQ